MNLEVFRCVACGSSAFEIHTTLWRCTACGRSFDCARGIPRLYLEEQLGRQDRRLRDRFYNGLLGRYYQFVMPFLTMPVRPLSLSARDWVIYFFALLAIGAVGIGAALSIEDAASGVITPIHGGALLALLSLFIFFSRHKYLAWLFILAFPVKIVLFFKRFQPEESFAKLHDRIVQALASRGARLRLLDVATGTCNSLHRHGWMKLDADYVAVDLSETMLFQGAEFMARQGIAVDFALADAARLPFVADSFDAVLSYGAVNGFSDPGATLREMARVLKPGGIGLFLDEQLYDGASALERLYFAKVLSSHNVVHACPVEQIPVELVNVEVKQVYHFYYICTAIKAMPHDTRHTTPHWDREPNSDLLSGRPPRSRG